ncbi:3-dehydroquinate synthase [Aureibaculum sp. 2210JD6-5]|uniref:3-dehydroquinate synthase n=1 Tax=Aureibaculum sp. 2210JD6-5 TaxID=3103957 RepID=UPI002AAC979E|nr:3-dehydroquinate synthase [Aureibaculum sp. 2210JD6-5]MDY7395105.1 3-dehydroquinate synthase [Aureibaculum sp. 2210JD6-5]
MTPIKSTDYSIYFNDDAYQQLNDYISNNQLDTIFVLVDENTQQLSLPKFKSKISESLTIETILIKAGEVNKNIDTCVKVWKKLTELEADRKSLIINLGGGMVTDLGGFVASTFKRGIKFINIPTTLLSMVDASVGSKTGVDLDNLKNLVGLFSNPEMVLIDTTYLETLPERELKSGVAEIIKYGLTFDPKLLDAIYQDKWKNVDELAVIISKSIQIKNKVVLEDYKETGLRKVLNFGHTVGHAIESYYLENPDLDSLLHGEAIAIGMVVEAYISSQLHNFPEKELENLKRYVLKTYGKTNIDKKHFSAILDLMKHDKKNTKGTVRYILLEDLGKFVIDAVASNEMVVEGMQYYGAK